MRWWALFREGTTTLFTWYVRPAPLMGALGVAALLLGVWGLAWWVAFDNAPRDLAALPTLVTGWMCLRGNYWKHYAKQQEVQP